MHCKGRYHILFSIVRIHIDAVQIYLGDECPADDTSLRLAPKRGFRLHPPVNRHCLSVLRRQLCALQYNSSIFCDLDGHSSARSEKAIACSR